MCVIVQCVFFTCRSVRSSERAKVCKCVHQFKIGLMYGMYCSAIKVAFSPLLGFFFLISNTKRNLRCCGMEQSSSARLGLAEAAEWSIAHIVIFIVFLLRLQNRVFVLVERMHNNRVVSPVRNEFSVVGKDRTQPHLVSRQSV